MAQIGKCKSAPHARSGSDVLKELSVAMSKEVQCNEKTKFSERESLES